MSALSKEWLIRNCTSHQETKDSHSGWYFWSKRDNNIKLNVLTNQGGWMSWARKSESHRNNDLSSFFSALLTIGYYLLEIPVKNLGSMHFGTLAKRDNLLFTSFEEYANVLDDGNIVIRNATAFKFFWLEKWRRPKNRSEYILNITCCSYNRT